MNVLLLTHRLPYAPNRGDRIRAFHLLRELSRFSDVSVFSFAHDDDEEEQVHHVPFAKRTTVIRVPRVRNLVRGFAAISSERPLTHILLDAPNVREALRAAIREMAPAVVVTYCSGMARFALEPPLAGLPFILDMVDVDSAKWASLAKKHRGPKAWIYHREAKALRAFEAEAARTARATMVVNEREGAVMREVAPGATVRVVQNGIDLDAFRNPSAPVESSTVAFCGVMNYAPNENAVQWFVHDIWPAVRARRPDARFVIIGSHPSRAILALASGSEGIEVTGSVPTVQPYLWNAAVAVAPLHESFGLQNKVLEALAAGLPVVTTTAVAAGLPGEALPGCSVRDNPASFAEAVVDMLAARPAERRAVAASSRLDLLDWSAQLKPLEGMVREAANR